MRGADVLITNGAGFEEGLGETIEAAEQDGVATFAAIDAVETLSLEDEDEHVEGAEEDERADDDEDGHDGVDPHFFTDPARMATAAQAIADFLVDEVPALDSAAFAGQVDAAIGGLHDLDRQVDETLAAVPAERRTLVTNHEVFGYFADRYGFEVVGAVIPSISTEASPSAGEIDELAATITAEGVPAIFADTSSPASLADTLADEVGDVAVVELYSESLGDPGSGADTYAGMMRTNATRIADALS
jgi:zinc/manganese transport system substrate-binding protein